MQGRPGTWEDLAMSTPLVQGAVVVGLDGSAQSLVALDWAIETAQLEDRSLHLVHAYGRHQGSDGAGTAIIDCGVQRVRVVDPGRRVSTASVAGSGGSALISASRQGALVCVGAHGRGGLVPALLGSTALAVAASARCPVAVIRPSAGREPARRIVVGVDESAGCHDAIGFAFSQADLRRLRLTAVHAWHASDRIGLSAAVTPWEKWRTAIGNEEAALAESLAGWTEKYPDVELSRVSIRKQPAAAILAAADDAALVVLGAHHPRPRPDLIGSSTVRKVLQGARCPVVIVPQVSS
jgi:nucleotide-binding universal stress UspA family protein